jgi:hypothetical protein
VRHEGELFLYTDLLVYFLEQVLVKRGRLHLLDLVREVAGHGVFHPSLGQEVTLLYLLTWVLRLLRHVCNELLAKALE